ncbi:MAG TPA: hypothetical protein VHN80_20985, partial [Kineosporiaceae bacterium]|nr:hypothetical protein [Kineosporiaceae bacterium]
PRAAPARPVLATPPAARVPASAAATASSFRFVLPAGVAWAPDGDRRVASGARIRRWRFQPPGHSPACVVTTGELAKYRGAFPAAELAAFAGARESGAEVLRNESITPPAGAVAAIRQEQSFVSVVAGAGTVRSHLHVRQALTTDRTLVAVYAAGPDDAAGRCRPKDTAASLVVASPTGGSSPTSGETS